MRGREPDRQAICAGACLESRNVTPEKDHCEQRAPYRIGIDIYTGKVVAEYTGRNIPGVLDCGARVGEVRRRARGGRWAASRRARMRRRWLPG